jgi:hypothetical protein
MPLPTVVNTNLAGFTVNYNGVQFGGADSGHKSLPPTYDFRCDPVYDDTGRVVIWNNYYLEVDCIFWASDYTEATMSGLMRSVRELLTTPGQQLSIGGLGAGFKNVPPIFPVDAKDVVDLNFGPKPVMFEMHPIGQIAYEVRWAVTWASKPCVGTGISTNALAFTHFNFSTTWRNDFEGYSSRMIRGSVGISGIRTVGTKAIAHIAEETRGSIIVLIPPNFRRVENVWSESDDKTKLNFNIVDEQLPGDPFPPGITAADANFSFATGGGPNGMNMASGIGTLTMRLKTAYNQPKNLAGQIFIAAALNKAADIRAALGGATGAIVPVAFQLSTGKWESARLTTGQVSWKLTKDFNTLLTACGIFDPIRLTGAPGSTAYDGSYTQWAASMLPLWSNLGVSGYRNLASEADLVDLCDNLTTKTIGGVSSSPNNPSPATVDTLSCPSIADNAGWLHFDLQARVLREDEQTLHKPASSFLPATGQLGGENYGTQPHTGALGTAVKVGGSPYSQSSSEQSVTEYHGYPLTYIGVTFVGVRYKHPAWMPEIQSVAGQATRLYKQDVGTPVHVGDSFGCPISKITGYRIYTVPGPVSQIKSLTSLVANDSSVPVDI